MFKGLRTFLKIQGALATLAVTRVGWITNGLHVPGYAPSPVATPVAAAPPPPSPVARAVPMPVSGGGGYSGRSNNTFPSIPSVGPAPAPQPMSLADSPSYQAFMRGLALEQSQAQSSTQDRIDALNRELARQIPEVQQAGDYTRQGIMGNMESRGIYRSGEDEQAIARQRAAEAQQISSLQGGVADQSTLLTNDLARRVADIQRRSADAALTAAGQTFTG